VSDAGEHFGSLRRAAWLCLSAARIQTDAQPAEGLLDRLPEVAG